MRDKLIELLCDCQHEYDKAYMEAIVGKRLPPPERVFFADHLIANGVTVNEWISVEERLPEKNSAVIVCTRTENVFQALYRYDGWDLLEAIAAKITHWMPLPQPPKEVE